MQDPLQERRRLAFSEDTVQDVLLPHRPVDDLIGQLLVRTEEPDVAGHDDQPQEHEEQDGAGPSFDPVGDLASVAITLVAVVAQLALGAAPAAVLSGGIAPVRLQTVGEQARARGVAAPEAHAVGRPEAGLRVGRHTPALADGARRARQADARAVRTRRAVHRVAEEPGRARTVRGGAGAVGCRGVTRLAHLAGPLATEGHEASHWARLAAECGASLVLEPARRAVHAPLGCAADAVLAGRALVELHRE
mmetsp:Transcript_99512/g.223098  ORF Transcript_99512/g.223098 Transcript_99512/m.223098 type:complete len:249 (+) Transcript_99512:2011-2757(+)